MLGLSRLSFGSSLVHTSQEHAMTGTPADVPVPKKVHEKLVIVTCDTGCFNQWTNGQSLKEKTHKNNSKRDWNKCVF